MVLMRSISETPPAGGRRGSGLSAQLLDQAENAEDLVPVADHLSIAGLPPAENAVAIDDERGAERDIAVLVVDAVGADGGAMHVAQEGKGERVRAGEGVVAERRVTADAEEGDPPPFQLPRDLSQAAELRRSDAAEVVAVECEDDVRATAILRQGDRAAERRRQRELGRGLSEAGSDHR